MEHTITELPQVTSEFICTECGDELGKIWWFHSEDSLMKICYDCTPQAKKAAKIGAGLSLIIDTRTKPKSKGKRRMKVVGKATNRTFVKR